MTTKPNNTFFIRKTKIELVQPKLRYFRSLTIAAYNPKTTCKQHGL